MPIAVGIDLGTTYSAVAALVNGKVEVIANDFGLRTTPSCVAFVDGEDHELVGEAAASQAPRNPTNTIYDAKRLIGRSWNEQSVQDDVKCWPFKVTDDGGKPAIHVVHNDVPKKHSPEEISAMVLRKLKSCAEDLLGHPVTQAVVTVPAYFSDSQRRATREAGELAGLQVLRLVTEPTAAALAYGLEHRVDHDRQVLIFDLGGGTFDVSIVVISGCHFAVKAVGGNSHLGGIDFDHVIFDYVAEEVQRKLGIDVRSDPRMVRRLLAKCERAKRDLSAMTRTVIDVTVIVMEDYGVVLQRAKFEELSRELLNRCADTVKSTLAASKLVAADIDEVILVGGSTRMPCVERLLSGLFPGRPVCKSINPDEAVAYGAALWAAFASGDQTAFLQGLHVQNVTPLSIGTDMRLGEFLVYIPRNTPIPVRMEKGCETMQNNQEAISWRVYQGERPVAARNKYIGKFILHDLPSAPAGLPVNFALSIDEDGILTVQAKLQTSSEWESCTLKLDDVASTEIVSNLEDAERFRKEDEKEAKRLRAKSDLCCALRNEKDKVRVKKLAEAEEMQKWYNDHQDASVSEFKKKLSAFRKLID